MLFNVLFYVFHKFLADGDDLSRLADILSNPFFIRGRLLGQLIGQPIDCLSLHISGDKLLLIRFKALSLVAYNLAWVDVGSVRMSKLRNLHSVTSGSFSWIPNLMFCFDLLLCNFPASELFLFRHKSVHTGLFHRHILVFLNTLKILFFRIGLLVLLF